MPFPRLAGIILHPTSLPGGHGVGDMGRAAKAFIDFLEQAGIGLWQVLPLGPTGGANSPYQTASSFAGNPLLISLDNLVELELLEKSDLANAPRNTDAAQFDAARAFKDKALRKALDRFQDAKASADLAKEFELYQNLHKDWLPDFALFMAAKDFYKGAPWFAWPDRDLRNHTPEGRAKFMKLFAYEVRFHAFCQFLFFRQWGEVRRYAMRKNVSLLGDVPIYCAHDSADVWADPQYFRLDENVRKTLFYLLLLRFFAFLRGSHRRGLLGLWGWVCRRRGRNRIHRKMLSEKCFLF